MGIQRGCVWPCHSKQGGNPESYLGFRGLGGSSQSAISRNTEGSWFLDACCFGENRAPGRFTLCRPSRSSKSFNSLIKQSNK